jgi:hypothetical protein
MVFVSSVSTRRLAVMALNQNGPRRLRRIKGLHWQTLVRGDIGRQRLFRPLANPGEVEASCVFRVLMRYEVKQHDFKMFEGDP